MTTCRICFEECEERTLCLCKGYVHQACLDQWLDISGRNECEICLQPLREEEEEEVEEPSFAALFSSVQVIYNAIYAIMLFLIRDWNYPVGMAIIGQSVMIILFSESPIHPENVLLTGKWTNFMTLTIVYGVTYATSMDLTLDVVSRQWRTALVEIDAFLFVFVFLLRILVGVCRTTTFHGT